MTDTVLILGARGRFGWAAARAFADAGWRVLGLVRPGAALAAAQHEDPRMHWIQADLQDTQALASAARGATVVVHALNPAYTHKAWTTQALPMTQAAVRIARALQATLMFMGNVYNFGTTMPALLAEDTPQQASTVKGRVRMALEACLQDSGVPTIVMRAGDFFGSGRGTWFDQAMLQDLRKGRLCYPGQRDVPTAWAYLPDLARTFVRVAEQRACLPRFAVFHFAGHTLTGQQWLDALAPIARARGWVHPGRALKWGRLPWGLIRFGALFIPTWAALLEMRYLWDTPHRLDNRRLTDLLGAEPHTPLPQALEATLADLDGPIKGGTDARPQ